jgi:phospho-N-acetylmuramoyl-pentapeptide-transferase
MIIWLSDFISDPTVHRLFSYITFRALMAVLTSFAIGILLGRKIINVIYQLNFRDRGRAYGDISPKNKDGTPTMGGLIIFFSLLISVLLWGNWKTNSPNNFFLGTIIFTAFWFTALGFFDDYLKNIRGHSDLGLSRSLKLFFQALFGLILALLVLTADSSPFAPEIASKLFIPFLKAPILDLGIFYYPFIILTIIAIANSINFADGLDGLATVPAALLVSVYIVFAYIMGNFKAAKYLWFPFINGSGELVVVLAALVGALAAFLWFNAYPAEIFMGDTGSLLLGGVIGTSAVLLKQELLFLIAGGIFVIEFLSVFIQDYIGIKLLKRRIFYRAPIHHTYQFLGIAESKIVVRFWILAAIFTLISLISIKLR